MRKFPTKILFSPSYLVAYSSEGSELWRKEFNTTSVSAASDLIAAGGYLKNGSVVKVFDIKGEELWSLNFGEEVATNGKIVASGVMSVIIRA
ncbi:hypothetical protein [Thermococcus sp. 2319x1]|uniref:hypothetical protein n=1 Tax=Thermococcus sp. 2319x1 TaxID=1674923 RepID=UPI00073D6718|nr:hypothetical protein [Thermococcus sp. 2319x1]